MHVRHGKTDPSGFSMPFRVTYVAIYAIFHSRHLPINPILRSPDTRINPRILANPVVSIVPQTE